MRNKSVDEKLLADLLADGEPVAEIARQCNCAASHVMSLRPLLARNGLIIPGYKPHPTPYNKRGRYEEPGDPPCSDPRFRPQIGWERKSADWTPEHKAAFMAGNRITEQYKNVLEAR